MTAANRCNLRDLQDKRDLIEVSQLIDLTDKPIGLTRDEIGWSRVRSVASNCICCCSNNSITLVTTERSYILDHVPLDNIQSAQTNPNLQYLALSNHRKIAVIELVDNDMKCGCHTNNTNNSNNSSSNNNNNQSTNETKVVNLSALGLTMNDVIYWRWLDDSTLAILSYEALYTCQVNQPLIGHPAFTALTNRSHSLNLEKVFDINQHLSELCQITDVQRDLTGNFYTISSLYSANSLLRYNANSISTQQQQNINVAQNQSNGPNSNSTSGNLQVPPSATLRPTFGSVPSRLSQLTSVETRQSLDSCLKSSEHLLATDQNRSHASAAADDVVCGLVQVFCKNRDRSQLIQAHAITFTNSLNSTERPKPTRRRSSGQINESSGSLLLSSSTQPQTSPTILVAANKIGNQMRVHFIEMASQHQQQRGTSTSGQNAAPTTTFNRLTAIDFPTAIVCSHVSDNNNSASPLHVALITTKHGQLFVCSVTHSTILFSTTITNHIISSTILESNTKGIMVICRSGQVLLVRLNLARLLRLMDGSKTLCHISSSHNILSAISETDTCRDDNKVRATSMDKHKINSNCQLKKSQSQQANGSSSQTSGPSDLGLEILMSTRL